MADLTQICKLTFQSDTTALDKATASFDKLAAAETKASAAGQSVVTVHETQSRSAVSVAKALDGYTRAMDPASKALASVERGERLVAAARAQGLPVSESALRAIQNAKARHEEFSKAVNDNAKAMGLNRMQSMELMHVTKSLFDEMAAGASPLRALTVEGGRIGEIFSMGSGGVGGTLSAIGSSLGGIFTVSRLAAGGLAGMAIAGYAAWSAWDDKVQALSRSLNGLGRGTGLSTSALSAMALTQGRGLSVGASVDAAASYAGAGIDGQTISQLLGSTRRYSHAFGLSPADATGELTKAFSDPSSGADDLAKRFGPLGYEVERQIKTMQALGDVEGARAKLFSVFDAELRKTKDTTGLLAKAMEGATNAASGFWAQLGKVGAAPTPQEDLEAALRRRDNRGSSLNAYNNPARDAARTSDVMGKWQAATDPVAKALRDQDELAAKEKDARDARLRVVVDDARIGAAAILGRTAAEKLVIDQERIRMEAARDSSKALTATVEAEKARTLALAESQRLLRDTAIQIGDQGRGIGASAAEKARIENQIWERDLREKIVTPRQAAASISPGAPGAPGDIASMNERLARIVEMDRGGMPDQSPIARNTGGSEFGNITRPKLFSDPPAAAASRSPAVRDLTIGGGDVAAMSAQRLADRLKELWIPALNDSERALAGNAKMLDVQVQTFGLSTEQVVKATEAQKLENQIRAQGLDLTDAMRAKIEALSKAQGDYAARQEAVDRVQKSTIQSLDMARDTFSDVLGSPLKALATHQNPGKALQEAGARLGGKLIDNGVNSLTEMFLGQKGTAKGGILSGLFGGASSTTTANMNVQAGNVMVVGGGAASALTSSSGATGGGGFLSSIFGGLFGGGHSSGGGAGPEFANGGIMTSRGPLPLNRYANGGIASSPQLAMFGEGRGPEAYVPLPDGKSIPVAMKGGGGGQVVHIGGPVLTIQGNVTEDILPKVQQMIGAANQQTVQTIQRNFGKMSSTYQARHG